jgi:hypothetical protein
MQTKALNASGMFSLVMLVFCFAMPADGPITGGTSDEQILQPVQHRELIGILAEIEKAKDKLEVHWKFHAYPKEQRLEALAYALKEGINTDEALQEIINDQEMQDRRLTPFLSKVIRKADGKDLFKAVYVVNRLPTDQALLESLMDHALQGDYVKTSLDSDGRHASISVQSTFVEAAKAIYRITNGKVGLSKTRSDYDPSEQEKQSLIQKWRQTLSAENKPGK